MRAGDAQESRPGTQSGIPPAESSHSSLSLSPAEQKGVNENLREHPNAEKAAVPTCDALQELLSATRWVAAFEAMSRRKNPPGPDGLTLEHMERQLSPILGSLRESIRTGTYRPGPYRVVTIASPKTKRVRLLAWLNLPDKWVQRVLQDYIVDNIDSLFADSCLAYRKGRGVETAVERITSWLKQGYTNYLRADIADYFGSIAIERLLERAGQIPKLAPIMRLVESFLKARGIDEMGNEKIISGLPLGFPLSPCLANLFLMDFDRQMEKSGLPYLRFGDDLFFMGRSAEEVSAQIPVIQSNLSRLGLALKPGKTKAASVRGSFSFLGHVFKGGASYRKDTKASTVNQKAETSSQEDGFNDSKEKVRSSMVEKALSSVDACREKHGLIAEEVIEFDDKRDEAADKGGASPLQSVGRQVFLRTVYLTEQGAMARLENQNLLVSLEDRQERVPLRKMDQIVTIGRVNLTTPLLHECLKQAIPVVFLSHKGNYVGRLEPLFMQQNSITFEQMKRAEDPMFSLQVARSVISGRIRSQVDFLDSRRKDRGFIKRTIGKMEDLLMKLNRCQSIQELMGYEGQATKEYFLAYGRCFKQPMNFAGRNRRPPRDPVNALLSFGYTLLYNEIRAILTAHGMDVRVGFLHGGRSNRPALAMDLIEEFRAPVVERMVLRVLNQGIFKGDDFVYPEKPPGACFLSFESRRRFIEEYELALRWKYHHLSTGLSLDVRRIISLQVICMKRLVRGSLSDYIPARLKYT
ncbi:MAG: CRISPR-associated endonuclease Cas1 [Deltaproteobacteria bacterium]|nr:CRISPR-associated endonuclease Cas1 [Deltaproteobacteria bacterium]